MNGFCVLISPSIKYLLKNGYKLSDLINNDGTITPLLCFFVLFSSISISFKVIDLIKNRDLGKI